MALRTPTPPKKNPICFTTKAEKKDIPIKLSKTNQLSYSYKSTSLDTNYHPKHADFYQLICFHLKKPSPIKYNIIYNDIMVDIFFQKYFQSFYKSKVKSKKLINLFLQSLFRSEFSLSFSIFIKKWKYYICYCIYSLVKNIYL